MGYNNEVRAHAKEVTMPHIVVKLWPGRSEEQKQQLADRIVQTVMETLNMDEKSISVGIEEVASERWTQEVYVPDILERKSSLYKKPGY